MIGSVTRSFKVCAVAVLLLVLANCQVMDSSVTYEVRPDGSQARRCDSGLGSYALPYSTITFKVTQPYKSGVKVGRPRLEMSRPEAHPDPKHIYCLDFLENSFSDDNITVAYDKRTGSTDSFNKAGISASGLLSLIASKNVDQTGDIIRNFLRAIFIFSSGDYNFSFNRLTGDFDEIVMMTEQTVDPFDLSAMASLNKSFAEYGFCITLGKFTVDESRYTPNRYCDNPDISFTNGAGPPFLRAAKEQRYLVETLPTGVFYRPRQRYPLDIYVRDDPPAHKAWELRWTDGVMLENLSPILVLHINRTIFAEYRTALAFDRGNLLDVCIAKGSEVAGGLSIPLDIVYGLVSLPAATIGQEITSKTTTAALISKQKDILALQDQILQAKAGQYYGGGATSPEPLGANLQFPNPSPISPSAKPLNENKFGSFCGLLKTS
ncbi:hypothetical protein Rleg_5447 (plasmid) [Rhizobium leguminosarum bv. trifolii WSM1325]|uniref:Transmembrane protein n=1 Tax=Rhizobium leguminosarum bv. trifolii (strain WSM1325) TaxID=395491 RepID=C6B8N1_RHILS|nr:hypothetical protein [Rhizobium leguminosarum]ACS60269.1 hypothetical protein Rleg_5447 [Rhizobium leguminosarum bv. trifolii WSM1325]